MGDVLIYADTTRSPEMRHELPLTVPDPFLYAEHDGKRYAVATSFEIDRINALGRIEALPVEDFGWDELLDTGMEREDAELEVMVRACQKLGISSATVPPFFPLELADHLRAGGIEVKADRNVFVERRRVKNEAELAGIRRAQAAAEAAMVATRALLRRAKPSNGSVVLDGEPLTSERIKAEIIRVFSEHDVSADEFIVSHGPQSAVGHEMGFGPIAPDEPIVVDIWPRDRESGCYADMTRTFVVGTPSDELVEYQRLVLEALERSHAAIKPGVQGTDVFRQVCEFFHEHGHPTQLSKEPGQVLLDGFFHGLGHGVGLEVHEQPWLGRAPGKLVAGDVITLEPGLYRQGYGGCRLEDLVLVTEDGGESLTDHPYDLKP